jgi:methyl-accepting chemotaxis protein
MRAWSDLKIGARLAIGIGILLALLVTVAGSAYYSLSGAKESFGNYRLHARETKTAYNWNGDLLAARLAFKNFLIDGTPQSKQKVEEALKLLTEEVEKEKVLFPDPADDDAVDQTVSLVGEYYQTFEHVAELRTEVDDLIAKMSELGPKLDKQASALSDGATASADITITRAVAELRRSLLLFRLYNSRFQHSQAKTDVDTVREQGAAFSKEVTELAKLLKGPEESRRWRISTRVRRRISAPSTRCSRRPSRWARPSAAR